MRFLTVTAVCLAFCAISLGDVQDYVNKVALPHYTGTIQPVPRSVQGIVFYPFSEDECNVIVTEKSKGMVSDLAVSLLKRRVREEAGKKSNAPKSSVGPVESQCPLEIIIGRLADVSDLEKKYICRLKAEGVVLQPQGYIIRVRQAKGIRRIFALGYDRLGTFYAAMTVLQQIGLESGRLGVRIGDIEDWPEWRYRYFSDYEPRPGGAMLQCAINRISGFAVQHRQDWRNFRSDFHPRWQRRAYGVNLDEMRKFKQETGLVKTMLLLHIYVGSGSAINLASDSEIDELLQVCRYAAKVGFDHIMIGVDDRTRNVDGRYVCFYKEEQEKFGDSIGRAHGYLMRRLYGRLKKEYPELELSIVSAPYSTLDHKVHERVANQEYLRDLVAELPSDVAVVWTGPRVISSEITRKDFLQYSNYCNSQPLYLWDNSNCFDRPMPLWKTKMYPGFSNDSQSKIYVNVHLFGWPWEWIFSQNVNDYLWNPDGYQPEHSYLQAVQKTHGVSAGEVSVKLRGLIMEARKREDNPARQEELLASMEPLMKKMESLNVPTRHPKGFINRVRDSITEPVLTMSVPRLSQKPKLDGLLNDPCWKNATRFSFQSVEKGRRVYNQTNCLVGYDNRALYLGFTATHTRPPRPVKHTGRRDEDLFGHSDTLEVFLQRKEDLGYAHLAFDVVGNMYDSAELDPQAMGRDWNPKWTVRRRRSTCGKFWTAEVMIPFSSVRDIIGPRPKPGDILRANFCREAALGDDSAIYTQWSRTLGSFHRPKRFGYLKFE